MDRKILFIGLIEEGKKRDLLKITNELFISSGYDIIYKREENVFGYSNNENVLIVFDFVAEDVVNFKFPCLSFDVVVYSSIDNNYLGNIIDIFKKSKVCIYNSDGEGITTILANLDEVIAINYGFNNKATLTISSYDSNEYIEANVCLQRSITPFCGEKIEPFELMLKINSSDEKIVYPLLASTALNLLLGDSVLNKKLYNNIILDYEN